MKKTLLLFCIIIAQCASSFAHVGSPDVVMEAMAGPYHVLVSIKPPDVIPGTAAVTVFVQNGDATGVFARPIYFRSGDEGAPAPDNLPAASGKPGQFKGIVWLMSGGSSSVQVSINGSLGSGVVVVPVVAMSTALRTMPSSTGYMLVALGLFLFILMVTIIGSSVSDGIAKKGQALTAAARRSKVIALGVAAICCSLALYGGNAWWKSWATDYRQYMFKATQAVSTIEQKNGVNEMTISIDTLSQRKSNLSFVVPDHGKMMHMFIMRIPAMDAFAHLHPVRIDSATFKTILPALPKGKYLSFADIVYTTGFAETIRDTFEIKENLVDSLHKMDADDAYAFALPGNVIDNPMLADANTILCGKPGKGVKMKDGSTMVWENMKDENLEAGEVYNLRFAVLDENNQPAKLQPYLGMMGHAAVIRDDGNVYVHIHPVGTYSVSAEESITKRIAQENVPFYQYPDRKAFRDSIDNLMKNMRDLPDSTRNFMLMKEMNMPGSKMKGMEHDNIISFPYTFPSAGQYRVWVQVKRNGKVLTAAFDRMVK